MEVKILPSLYKKSKMEAVYIILIIFFNKPHYFYEKVYFFKKKMGWLVTFLGVMILNVDIGLYIGIGFSLLLIIFRSQR
jgi:MFS superfamily sulfate permease-like transporter